VSEYRAPHTEIIDSATGTRYLFVPLLPEHPLHRLHLGPHLCLRLGNLLKHLELPSPEEIDAARRRQHDGAQGEKNRSMRPAAGQHKNTAGGAHPPDGEDCQHTPAARGTSHGNQRTGRRRRAMTMRGALETTPASAKVRCSSSMGAPRYFTTYAA